MTEEEARTKRCCGPEGCGHVYGASHVPQITGGYVSSGGERYCIGSACMAWLWAIERGPVADHVMRSPSHGEVIATEIGDRRSATDGFCGLAGKP